MYTSIFFSYFFLVPGSQIVRTAKKAKMKRAGTREKSEGASSPLSPSPARFVFAFRPHYLRAIRYRNLLASKKTIGSFINVDGDSEENVKKAIDQNNNLDVHYTFWYISLPSLHDLYVKTS